MKNARKFIKLVDYLFYLLFLKLNNFDHKQTL